MSIKRKATHLLFTFLLIGLIGVFFHYLTPSVSEAQGPQCIAYVPTIVTEPGTGTFGSGTICERQTISHNFGFTIAGQPIVALQGWNLEFTDSNHHYKIGLITIPTGTRPQVVGGGTTVQFDVRACLADKNDDDDVRYDFWYTIAVWPQ